MIVREEGIMRSILKKNKNSTFFRIMALVMIPAILVIVSAIIVANIYIINYKNSIEASYFSKISCIANYNENSLISTSQLLDVLKSDNTFMQVIAGYDSKSESIRHVQDVFEKIKKNNNMIDSIIAVERKSKKVYTTTGVEDMQAFFTDNYVYDDYNYDYWYSYQAAFSSKRIFPPCQVNTKEASTNIIPIIFTKIDNEPFGNIIIVNIRMSALKQGFEDEKISENGKLYLFSLSRQCLYSIEGNIVEKSNPDFSSEILSDKKTFFEYEVNGEKSMIVSYNIKNSVLGYSYVAIVPCSEINRVLYKKIGSCLGIGIIMWILVVIGAFFSSKKIILPMLELLSKFQKDKYNYKGDVIKQIQELIDDTISSNIELSNKTKMTMPLLQEWYLIKLLNSNENYRFTAESRPDIEFEYEWFCSVVFQIRLTKFFYEYYEMNKYNAVRSAISEFIVNSFEEFYKTYIVSSEADVIYLVLNLKDFEEPQKIQRIITKIHNILQNDKEYLTCISSSGGIYKGLEGLKKSHDEAVGNIYRSPKFERVEIAQQKPSVKKEKFQFNTSEENELYRYIFASQSDKAVILVNSIIEKNMKKALPKNELVNMYVRLFYVVCKVLREKNIPYDTENVGDFTLINNLTMGSDDEIHKRIIDMIRMSETYSNKKVETSAIVDYIRVHFAEDLYLDKLSEIFGLSPKYLSKILKEEIGVNFKDYLITLRINKAIELLKKDMPIAEIYKMVGFNNRNTFNRLFKAKTGLTPTEYKREMEH